MEAKSWLVLILCVQFYSTDASRCFKTYNHTCSGEIKTNKTISYHECCQQPLARGWFSQSTGVCIECVRDVDGAWSSWSQPTCSKQCGIGRIKRVRKCDHPAPKNNGKACEGFYREVKVCYGKKCPVNGGWSSWSKSACSVTCGAGKNIRRRECNSPTPKYNGTQCEGSATMAEDCYENHCPVNGGWGTWSRWTTCDKNCDVNNMRSRERKCNNPFPSNGGNPCYGTHSEKEFCPMYNCPVSGGWADWAEWSGCSIDCGKGYQSRNRACTNPKPKNGGEYCTGFSIFVRACNGDCHASTTAQPEAKSNTEPNEWGSGSGSGSGDVPTDDNLILYDDSEYGDVF